MDSRYKKPPTKPPSVDDVPYLLAEARAGSKEALKALLAIARAALVDADEAHGWTPYPLSRFGAIPRELREYLELNGLRILLADNPHEALQHFLGKRKRGEHVGRDNRRRDILIATDVVTLRRKGETRDDACSKIAEKTGLSEERVLRIYNQYRDTLEVRAELEWAELR